MKESNPFGQIAQLNTTTFATRLRWPLELRNTDSYAIKMNIFCFASLLLWKMHSSVNMCLAG